MPGIIVIKGGWSPVPPPRSKNGDLVLLRAGVDIALQYFNSDDEEAILTLTTKARKWADRYFKGYRYATKRPTALLRVFPDLFNLRIPAHRRLAPSPMPSPSNTQEPEGASPRDLRRAERKAMNTESFPEFAEPTLASDAELDQIVDLRARQPKGAAKPAMRVDAGLLRDSGLLRTLPEFLGQLARANLETETMLANDPDAVRLELDDDQAAEQAHVEMNLFPGLVETQRRRQKQRMVLPSGRPLELPGGINDNIGSEDAGRVQGYGRHSTADEDSGDETDASTSTTASLHANIRKRKAGASSDADEASPPNKIRLQYQYPPPQLRRFDMKRRKLVTTRNPAADLNDPFEATSVPASPTRPASSCGSSGSSSSGGPTRIIKIRVSCSPDSSRASSPDSQGSRVIVLRDPRSSPPPSSAASPRSSPPRHVIRLKSPRKAEQAAAATSGNCEHTPSRFSSPGSSSGSDGSSASRVVRIKVVQRSRHGEGRVDAPKVAKRRLIEEVEE
ncbi:hypothetical protein BT67DRAFT_447593 [Trichocladium antarcticum]|uniref:Uncharacterized protein n=1 Tax=Trichocladium antarcticum TaxID=1450529 RepID=A0AAN6URU6_9PEZI|nr:hypothetical protein BT67DRAFT_447593 [Trichocladium antarcticum]